MSLSAGLIGFCLLCKAFVGVARRPYGMVLFLEIMLILSYLFNNFFHFFYPTRKVSYEIAPKRAKKERFSSIQPWAKPVF